MGQLRNGADDGPAILFARKVMDETAIDLDLVEGEGPQIAQGRVAGTEIVHRDTHAESPQLPQHGGVLVRQESRLISSSRRSAAKPECESALVTTSFASTRRG
jgi:hypothetical protein